MTTPFWQMKDPVKAYLAGLQKFVGVPQTGIWDVASHIAIYKLANQFNPEVTPNVAWGTEPEKTVGYVIGLVDEADDPDSFAAVRGLLGNLGYPIMSFEDAQKWVENLSEEEAKVIEGALKAVAEVVGRAESGPIPPLVQQPPPANQPVNQTNQPAAQTPAANGGPAPSNGTPPPANGAPPPSNGAPPITNGGTLATNGGTVLATTTGMKTGTKVAIGIGVAAGALLIGWLAYKAFKKPEGGPPTGGCGCGG